MKNLTKLWSLALLLTAAMFMVSCEEEEPTIDVDEEGLSVANGYYFTLGEEDPAAEKALLPEKVEGAEFAATDREGFFGNYVFLASGEYQLKKVEDREVTSTIGGTLSEPEGEDEGYLIAEASEDGETINVTEQGYYKVSYDEQLSELIMMRVTSVSLIGDATPNGWTTDTQLDVLEEASDEGFIFSGNDIEMRGGEFKIRINNRWTIDRRIDRTAESFDPSNGYVAFTNYGGAPSNLVAGGANMPFSSDDEGLYTVTIELTNDGGAAMSTEFTGEVEPIVFDPAENNWAVVGGATDLGWPVDGSCDEGLDMDMNYDGEIDGAYTWSLELNLANDEFKFRKNDCWDGELGFGEKLSIEGPDADNFTDSGGNISNSTAGIYSVVLSTADQGETYTVVFELLEETGGNEFDPNNYKWAVAGDATELGWPAGECGDEGEDVNMTYDGETEGTYTWTVELPLSVSEFKFRPNDCWGDGELNFSNTTIEGSASANFSNPDNGNISCDVAGTYSIVLTTSDEGANYVADFTLVE